MKKIRISIIKLKDLFQFLVFITEISLYFGKLLEKTEFTLKIYEDKEKKLEKIRKRPKHLFRLFSILLLSYG